MLRRKLHTCLYKSRLRETFNVCSENPSNRSYNISYIFPWIIYILSEDTKLAFSHSFALCNIAGGGQAEMSSWPHS